MYFWICSVSGHSSPLRTIAIPKRRHYSVLSGGESAGMNKDDRDGFVDDSASRSRNVAAGCKLDQAKAASAGPLFPIWLTSKASSESNRQ